MAQDRGLEEYMRRILKMRRLTKDHVVNTYWQQIQEIVENGFVAFILRGALCWKSPEGKRVESPTGHVWLKSNHYDPIGKPIKAEQVKTYLQWYLNLYEIWGGIRTEIDPRDEERAKEALEQSIRDISLLCNLISLICEASISWYPACFTEVQVVSASRSQPEEQSPYTEWRCLPLTRSQEEQCSMLVEDEHFEKEVLPFFEFVRSIGNSELAALLRRSIAWHATGNFLGSGLNRFLNYWESIELLAHFFYGRLPSELIERPSRSERKNQVLQILNQQVTPSNCLKIAAQCAKFVQPTIRSQMQSVVPILTGRKDFGEVLFEGDSNTGKSLYDIRNDIAHGNYCEHDLAFTALVEERLHDMRSYSSKVLWSTLRRVPILEEYLEKA